jgi:hypothetical protein
MEANYKKYIMNRVNYKVSNDLGQRYFPSDPKGTLGIVLIALCRYDLCNSLDA